MRGRMKIEIEGSTRVSDTNPSELKISFGIIASARPWLTEGITREERKRSVSEYRNGAPRDFL